MSIPTNVTVKKTLKRQSGSRHLVFTLNDINKNRFRPVFDDQIRTKTAEKWLKPIFEQVGLNLEEKISFLKALSMLNPRIPPWSQQNDDFTSKDYQNIQNVIAKGNGNPFQRQPSNVTSKAKSFQMIKMEHTYYPKHFYKRVVQTFYPNQDVTSMRFLGKGGFGEVFEISLKQQHSGSFLRSSVINKRGLKINMTSSEQTKQEILDVLMGLYLNHCSLCREETCVSCRDYALGSSRVKWISDVICQEIDLCNGAELVSFALPSESQKNLPFTSKDVFKTMSFIDLIHQITRCISTLHNLGIVHRDLKLENMMLCKLKNGKFGTKIIDFGMSHLFHFPPFERDYRGTPGFIDWNHLKGYLNDFYAYFWIIIAFADPELEYFARKQTVMRDLVEDDRVHDPLKALYQARRNWYDNFILPWGKVLHYAKTWTPKGSKTKFPITLRTKILWKEWKNQEEMLLPKLIAVYTDLLTKQPHQLPVFYNSPQLIQSFLPEGRILGRSTIHPDGYPKPRKK